MTHLVVTGANGGIGRRLVEHARAQGATVLGVDRTVYQPGPHASRNIDTTDLGQVFDALHGADAVVHLAAIPNARMASASTVFNSNMAGTWNVLEAAHKLGIKRVVIASSIQAVSAAKPGARQDYPYLPIDEDTPMDPQDDYGLSKALGEDIADMYAKHFGMTVLSLRFPWVVSPEFMASFPRKASDDLQLSAFTYLTFEDVADLCWRAASVPLPSGRHWPILASAKDTFLDTPTLEYVKTRFPNAELRGDLSGYASLVSGKRAETLLGFKPKQGWRK